MIFNMKYLLIILTLSSCHTIVKGTFIVQVVTNHKFKHLCAGAHINAELNHQDRGNNDYYLIPAHCLLENNIKKPEELTVMIFYELCSTKLGKLCQTRSH